MMGPDRRQILTEILAAAIVIAIAGATVPAAPAGGEIQFNRDIRPILSNKCFACHGFDPKRRKADLRLDTLDGATAARRKGPAIVPGDQSKSQLWARISSNDKDF